MPPNQDPKSRMGRMEGAPVSHQIFSSRGEDRRAALVGDAERTPSDRSGIVFINWLQCFPYMHFNSLTNSTQLLSAPDFLVIQGEVSYVLRSHEHLLVTSKP